MTAVALDLRHCMRQVRIERLYVSHSISRQANGIRQELHERSRGAESLKHQIQEIVAGHFLICQRSADGEVLALDVVDERVSRVITGWRPLQRFACHAAG